MGSIKTRVKNKIATEDEWQSINPILLNGEIVFSEVDSIRKIKVGDGVTNYSSLPFIDDHLQQQIDSKLNSIQGVAAAGKILRVGEDGIVYLSDAVVGSETVVFRRWE